MKMKLSLVLACLACTAMAQIRPFRYEMGSGNGGSAKVDVTNVQGDMMSRNPLRLRPRQSTRTREAQAVLTSNILKMPKMTNRNNAMMVQPTQQTFQVQPQPQTTFQTQPQETFQIQPQIDPRPQPSFIPDPRPQPSFIPDPRPQPSFQPDPRPQPGFQPDPRPQPGFQPLDSMFLQTPQAVPDCPLEVHPDTETMFIMRGPLGGPEPRVCPPGTYFLRSVCTCVNKPIDKCNLRPSAMGPGWYEENVFGMWIQRPCGPGSAYNHNTCDCSHTL